MKQVKNLEEEYNKCIRTGTIQFSNKTDISLIKSLLKSSKEDIKIYNATLSVMEKNKGFSYLFTHRYDTLRKLMDAYLQFDNLKCGNHHCTNAYLCKKNPEFKIKWEIIESMRLLRNSINYQGEIIDENIWNNFKPKFIKYIKILKNKVKQELISK